jgi:hypothetical protein
LTKLKLINVKRNKLKSFTNLNIMQEKCLKKKNDNFTKMISNYTPF